MTTLIQSMARVFLFLCTTFKQIKILPQMVNNQNPLWIVLLFILLYFILHRMISKPKIQAPLFSFPSLPQPLISVASFSLSQPLTSLRSISYPLVSLPSLSLQPIRFRAPPSRKDFAWPDADVEAPLLPSKPDVVIPDSVAYEDQSIYASTQSADDEGSSGTLDETWNSIVATGNAKPVRLFTSSQREVNRKSRTKKSTIEKRREKEKATAGTSYESVERRAQSPSTDGAADISSTESTPLSDKFIKKHPNNLRTEKQESSDQPRLARRRVRDYRNAISL